ncbi:hypothetical protein ACFL6W_03665 [Thermodesulfobacteriota bacterium]
MRNLFIVGAKLLGIFYCFWTISILPQILTGFRTIYSTTEDSQLTALWLYIISLLFSFFLNFVLGIIFIFYTNKIVSILKIPETPLQSEIVTPQYIKIGIILIGIYTLTVGIPEIPKSLIRLRMGDSFSFHILNDLFFSCALKIILGAFLTFGSDKITKLISK